MVCQSGAASGPPPPGPDDLRLDWTGPERNATRNLQPLRDLLPGAAPPLAEDLLDIATAVYLADVGVPRGANEHWVRSLELTVPVREPAFWRERAADLSGLLYVLTRDRVHFVFAPLAGEPAPGPAAGAAPFAADCVSLLSGGLDSLAGAVLLLRTGRQPLLVSHQSGNPTIAASQTAVREMLTHVQPAGFAQAATRLVAGGRAAAALPFPPPNQREVTQRSRAFLFMATGVLAAAAQGLREVYAFENGVLTVAVPLAGSRIGGQSTRSTHPRVMALLSDLCRQADLGCELLNPFVYQTKAELLRDILRPVLSPFEIQRTVSCWAAGRQSRQCGGCVACLVRRFSMLAAGLPDEAYQLDLLGNPDRYGGTDAYGNLVDLLTQAAEFERRDDCELLALWPELLDLPAAAISLQDVLAMYRRHAAEVRQVAASHFPRVAEMMHRA